MHEKILVTGFDSFGPRKKPNASSEIALPAVADRYPFSVKTLVLPTARKVASERLIEAIADIHPAAVVMFGISAGRKVRIETQAKNWQYNLLIPDNEGNRALGRIDRDGGTSYQSSLPIDNIYRGLHDAGVPTRFNDNAGSFVCNEVMYRALQHNDKQESPIPTGFIHFGNGLSDQLVQEAALIVVEEVARSARR